MSAREARWRGCWRWTWRGRSAWPRCGGQALSPRNGSGRWAACWPAVMPTWSGWWRLARRQSWLTAKICFLDRAGQIFKMWHVVHRPFSYAFLLLLAIHIGMALWMGFLRF